MKSLVIAEKPSVARDIARVLGANQKNGGILEGKNYVVTWALGHLVTLADPEEYDRKYEKWEMATLPMLPKEMKLVVIRQTGRQFRSKDSAFPKRYWRNHYSHRCRTGGGTCCPLDSGKSRLP